MLKYLFLIIVLVHGLIHVGGFAKVFGYGSITTMDYISKPAGVFWLITAFLFIGSAIMFFFKQQGWGLPALAAVIFSQVLLVLTWQDSKWGTIVNIIIAFVAMASFAADRFGNMVKNESAALLYQPAQHKIIDTEIMKGLPVVIQKWLTRSGVVGKESIGFVRLKQRGEMRTSPTRKWMPFTAVQYFSVVEPRFVWQANVQLMPLITMHGRDKFIDGKGQMLIKLLSLIKVVEASGNKVNSATMIRYLAEIMWFPTAALSDYIKWDEIDSTSAKATMTYKGMRVTGVFSFNEEGDPVSFYADRYYSAEEKATPEKWLVEATGYRSFQGIRIPHQNKVTWKLKTGDFNWANVELTDLEFNNPSLY